MFHAHFGWAGRLLGGGAAGILLVLVATASAGAAAAPSPASLCDPNDFGSCSLDQDPWSAAMEIADGGNETGLTFVKDTDNNGIPDVLELESCGNIGCIKNPDTDSDRNGEPDWLQRLVCGSVTCKDYLRDSDSDGAIDAAEFVICGTRTCADLSTDLDHDGKSDAAELAACLKPYPAGYVPPRVPVAAGGGQAITAGGGLTLEQSRANGTKGASGAGSHRAVSRGVQARTGGLSALPFTGANVLATSLIALALVCAGAVAVLARQRRRSPAPGAGQAGSPAGTGNHAEDGEA